MMLCSHSSLSSHVLEVGEKRLIMLKSKFEEEVAGLVFISTVTYFKRTFCDALGSPM